MGSLAFLALCWGIFTQVSRAKLPIAWTLGITLVVSWWLYIEISSLLLGFWRILTNPLTGTLTAIGIFALFIAGGIFLYLRREHDTSNPFKHF